MSVSVARSEIRTARLLKHGSRTRTTVAMLREFLADVDAARIPDDAVIRHETELSHEGSAYRIELSASVTEILDVPDGAQ